MADEVSPILQQYELDTSQAEAALDRMSEKLRSMEESPAFGALEQAISSVGKSAGETVTDVSEFGGGLSEIDKTLSEVNTRLLKTEKTLGDFSKSMDKMKKSSSASKDTMADMSKGTKAVVEGIDSVKKSAEDAADALDGMSGSQEKVSQKSSGVGDFLKSLFSRIQGGSAGGQAGAAMAGGQTSAMLGGIAGNLVSGRSGGAGGIGATVGGMAGMALGGPVGSMIGGVVGGAAGGGVDTLTASMEKLVAVSKAYVQQGIEINREVDKQTSVMYAMGKAQGYAKGQLDELIQSLRTQGITTREGLESVNLMIQAQMDLTKAMDLAAVAQNRGRIVGLDSSETYKRIVYGINTLSTVSLHYLGIMVSRTQAEMDYRKEMGYTMGQMLSFREQQEALANAVIKSNRSMSGAYEAANMSIAGMLQTMPRVHEETNRIVGEAFTPMADQFTKLFQIDIPKDILAFLEDNEAAIKDLGVVLGDLAIVLTGAVRDGINWFIDHLPDMVNALDDVANEAIRVAMALIPVVGQLTALGVIEAPEVDFSKMTKDVGELKDALHDMATDRTFAEGLEEMSAEIVKNSDVWTDAKAKVKAPPEFGSPKEEKDALVGQLESLEKKKSELVKARNRALWAVFSPVSWREAGRGDFINGQKILKQQYMEVSQSLREVTEAQESFDLSIKVSTGDVKAYNEQAEKMVAADLGATAQKFIDQYGDTGNLAMMLDATQEGRDAVQELADKWQIPVEEVRKYILNAAKLKGIDIGVDMVQLMADAWEAAQQRAAMYKDEMGQKLYGALESVSQKIVSIADQLQDWKIEAVYYDIDLALKDSRHLEDIARQHNRAMEDINRQQQYQMEDMDRQVIQQRIDMETKKNDSLIDLEKQYQRQIADIRLSFSRTARETAIRNDAIAYLQAKRTMGDQLQDAKINRDRQRADSSVNYERQERDFSVSLDRRQEDMDRALARQLDSLRLSEDRAEEDYRLSLDRQSYDHEIQLERRQAAFDLQIDRWARDWNYKYADFGIEVNRAMLMDVAGEWASTIGPDGTVTTNIYDFSETVVTSMLEVGNAFIDANAEIDAMTMYVQNATREMLNLDAAARSVASVEMYKGLTSKDYERDRSYSNPAGTPGGAGGMGNLPPARGVGVTPGKEVGAGGLISELLTYPQSSIVSWPKGGMTGSPAITTNTSQRNETINLRMEGVEPYLQRVAIQSALEVMRAVYGNATT